MISCRLVFVMFIIQTFIQISHGNTHYEDTVSDKTENRVLRLISVLLSREGSASSGCPEYAVYNTESQQCECMYPEWFDWDPYTQTCIEREGCCPSGIP